MNGHALAESIGAAGIFTVISVTVWQVAAIVRAKIQPREEKYHKLAETSVAMQENTDLQLREIALLLEDMRSRVTALERILKEVE
jgi:hypothetical protein